MREDKFEVAEMHDGAAIVHRDKRVTRRMAALIGLPGLFTIVIAFFTAYMNGSSARPLPPAMLPVFMAAMIALGFFFFGMALTFAVLRTVVTADAVHVKYGLWGPTIPLGAITKCSVVEYDWTEFGGWGLRYGRNNSRAYVPSNGSVVEVLYDDNGVARRVLIGVNDAAATVVEINRARAAKASARLRVADEVGSDAEEEAAAEEVAEEQRRINE